MKWLIFILLLGLSQAWWCNGHMLVALIAELDLLDSNPAAFKEANLTVAALNGALSHDLSNSFVESACWADDIKFFDLTYMNNAHFIDMPYNTEGLLQTPNGPEDVLWLISHINQTLLLEKVDTAPLETSYSIRFLIHLLGDMHQPLHCTQLWNSKFPNGDLGGNFFKITYDAAIKQLHALWDSGVGKLENDLNRPLSKEGWEVLHELADEFMSENPRNSFLYELSFKDPADWCLESFEKAVSTAYDGVVQFSTPSEEYLARGWALVKKQIALAGYRLSDLLQTYY